MLIGSGMMGECTMGVDVGRGQDGHSCNGHSGNARVPLEKVGFLDMGVQIVMVILVTQGCLWRR